METAPRRPAAPRAADARGAATSPGRARVSAPAQGRRAALRSVALPLAALLWPRSSHAQAAGPDYPVRPVRLVISFPPGGSTDIMARTLAPHLAAQLGQPVLIENRPGAGGNIGIDLVAKASADGYTIGMGAAGALAVNVSLYRHLPFDPLRDLAPVSLVSVLPFIVAVGPAEPAADLQALLARARAQPGRISLAQGGNGTAMHLTEELLRQRAGVDLTLVPYKGTGPATSALMAGEVSCAMLDMPSAAAALKAGRIRALAVTGAERLAELSQVPTVSEAGLAGFDAVGWFGIVAPAGTPDRIISTLNQATRFALAQPAVRERIAASGGQALDSTPQAFGAFIRTEIPKWAAVVRSAGTQAD